MAHTDDGGFYLWALVNTGVDSVHTKPRKFRIAGTGHPINHASLHVYINSVHVAGFVWHFFEIVDWR
jgi:hypothetical protein